MKLYELLAENTQKHYYHGSNNNFEKFSKVPVYFTQLEKFAKHNGSIIYTVELTVNKTFQGRDIMKIPPHKFGWDDLDNLTDIGKELLTQYDYEYDILKRIYLEHWDVVEKPETLNILKKHGYDSFYVTGDGERNIGVLDLNKIKIIDKNDTKKPSKNPSKQPSKTIEIIPETIMINGVERPTRNSLGKFIGNTLETIQNFYKWFGDSKVVDAKNRPIVVYHGSVQTFNKFDKSFASKEGNFGAGFYFTDKKTDATKNYFKGGPDFKNKVAKMAEQLENEQEISYKEAEKIVIQQLMGQPSLIETYLKIINPAYIGGKHNTKLFANMLDNVELDINDYEDEEEYYEAQDNAKEEALQTISYELDDYLSVLTIEQSEMVKQTIFDYIYNYDDGIDIEELKEKINELYIEDNETGDLIGTEVTRLVIESQGHDGIIDSTVSEKFKNMKLSNKTNHYIVFNSNQIKSVKNVGKFALEDENIFESDE